MLDRFTSMQVFLAVARRGTFAAAADDMDLSRAMASKHVKALETHLGVRLFDRTTRAIRLTEAGREYHDRIATLLNELEAVENRLSSDAGDVRGTLRIAAPVSFGALYVAPVIADYMHAHAEVKVQLMLADRAVNLVDEGIDIAVRVHDLEDSSYIARHLTAVRLIACASPGYLREHGTPGNPRDLDKHNCLVFAESPSHTHADWTFEVDGRASTVRVGGDLAANVGDAVRQVALRDRGVVRLPDYLVAADLEAGRLVEVLADFAPPLRPVYALYPHRDHVPGKVRSFIEFAMQAFGNEQAGEAGRRNARAV